MIPLQFLSISVKQVHSIMGETLVSRFTMYLLEEWEEEKNQSRRRYAKQRPQSSSPHNLVALLLQRLRGVFPYLKVVCFVCLSVKTSAMDDCSAPICSLKIPWLLSKSGRESEIRRNALETLLFFCQCRVAAAKLRIACVLLLFVVTVTCVWRGCFSWVRQWWICCAVHARATLTRVGAWIASPPHQTPAQKSQIVVNARWGRTRPTPWRCESVNTGRFFFFFFFF